MATISINGRDLEVSLEPERSLLLVLREEAGLAGAKYGCGEGQCGVCTVWMDGAPVHACKTKLADAVGREILTIEGLGERRELVALQRAFAEINAFQCGYCTPGMLVAAAALLAREPDPDEPAVRGALQTNLCRCGTYARILRAVRRAAEILREEPALPPLRATALPAIEAHKVPWDLLEREEPDWFEALGEGLVAVVPRPPPRGWPIRGGAWVHLSGEGLVTAGIGKVEVGQGTRTALALLVAEEARVPLARVRLVMGDTDVAPWDVGTFGSRATPDAGMALRRAAARVREVAVELAAQKWGVGRAAVLAADGRLQERGGARTLEPGALVRGLRRVEVVKGEPALTPASEWRTAGRDVPNVRSLEIVTAAKRFPCDVRVPGMLHGKVLRPPAFEAKLESADLSRAKAMEGVTVVRDGDFIGAVAPSLVGAARAIAAVQASWRHERQPSERDIADYLRAHPVEQSGWEGAMDHVVGDVEEGLAAAAVRLEQTYTTAYIAHVPIEPRVAIARWEGERLTVWTGTQVPFGEREEIAEALGIAEARVRVLVPDVGTGFGGKHTAEIAVEAARLARAAGKPVRVLWTREEEFTWGYFRPFAVIDVRSGAAKDGALVAWEFTNYNAGGAALLTPYRVPNQGIHYQPAASPLRQGPYRSLAAAANHFARESHMDELAQRLEVDPLEFRLRNLDNPRIAAVFRAAAERAGWSGRKRERGCGMGIAGGTEKGGQVATCAEVRVDGGEIRVLRLVTAFECGAVVSPQTLRNQVEGAAVMGLGGALFEAIHFEDGRILNPHLADYRVPRFGDLPKLEVVLLDRKDLPSAGGGETPLVAIAPAIANAVFAATGQRLRSLPLGRLAP